MSTGTGIPLFDDNPTTTDRLGFSTLVGVTVEALTRPNLDPVCVGVTGRWGAGKSSIVQQVELALGEQDDVLVVYVEPWAFDPNTDPKAHLIGDVLNAISERVGDIDDEQDPFKSRLRKLAKRVRWARAVRLAATTALTAQLPSVDKLADLFGPSDDDLIEEPSIDGFRDEFAELMSDDRLSDLARVVVVVDDLDRCLNDTVVDVLEAIKLFLSVPKMAFLVAADETAVRSAIASRYGDAPAAVELAERYLDKIVQIPIRVPVLDRIAIEAYVLQLLVTGGTSSGEDADRLLREHCDEVRHEAISSLGERPPSGVDPEHLQLAERLAPLLHVGLDGNPRRVKRFLNEMSQRERLAQSRGINVDRAAVAKLMVLEQVHPTEFDRLLSWVRSDELETRLLALDKDDGAGGALGEWMSMAPGLDGTTVRRYILLAASLRGEVVAVNALPEHLREIASGLVASDDGRRAEARRAIAALPVEDACHLGRYIAEAVRTQPTSQAEHAETLGRLAERDEAVADAVAAELGRMAAAQVDAALVIALAPPRTAVPPSIRSVVEAWQASDQLQGPARKAAAKALAEGQE